MVIWSEPLFTFVFGSLGVVVKVDCPKLHQVDRHYDRPFWTRLWIVHIHSPPESSKVNGYLPDFIFCAILKISDALFLLGKDRRILILAPDTSKNKTPEIFRN